MKHQKKEKYVLYFAYGSNMSASRMLQRGMRWISRESATLVGYVLTFDKVVSDVPKAGYATVRKSSGSQVEGILYTLNVSLRQLDQFEGYPVHYSRSLLSLITSEGIKEAYVYIATPRWTEAGRKPLRSYMAHLLKGASFLSGRYLARLKSWEVLDDSSQAKKVKTQKEPDKQWKRAPQKQTQQSDDAFLQWLAQKKAERKRIYGS